MTEKRAADIMSQPVVSVKPGALLIDAIKLLLRHHFSGLPVVNPAGELVGMITEHDVMNFALSGNAADTTVEEAMTTQVISLPPDARLEVVINTLTSRHLRRIPIVQGNKVVGVVSRRDVLAEMLCMYGQYH